jgi:hypothetical protein
LVRQHPGCGAPWDDPGCRQEIDFVNAPCGAAATPAKMFGLAMNGIDANGIDADGIDADGIDADGIDADGSLACCEVVQQQGPVSVRVTYQQRLRFSPRGRRAGAGMRSNRAIGGPQVLTGAAPGDLRRGGKDPASQACREGRRGHPRRTLSTA